MKSLPGWLFFVVCLLVVVQDCSAQTPKKCPPIKPHAHCDEVTVGVQVWSYDRLFPLLDGLFQDVAATQVAAVTLNPNSSNGAQLDALAQTFQQQLGYSQTAAAQNQATSQALNGNAAQQNLLLQQQSSLLQQIATAQSQVAQAQTTLQTDLANTQSTTATQTADASAVTQAQANLSALITQLNAAATQFKASGNLPSFSNPGTGTQVTPTAIPLSSVWSQSGNNPSFPATKQMDNQVQLLWERLSRLVGAMVKPDSAGPDDAIYLLQFDTGIFPSDRKNQLLAVNYELTCTAGTGAPTVIDMFPRVAAVNLTNTKYRDNQIFLGIPLNWFGIGSVTSYNREHLQVSQYLGQSSYITGQGVSQSKFGWEFGIPIGDNQLSSDTRKTFVLVSVPSTCTTPALQNVNAKWIKKNGNVDSRQDTVKTSIGAFPTAPAAAAPPVIESLDFNQVEYDQAAVNAANPVVVSLTLKLKKDIDQQQTIMVNGTLIKRARDGFGRAVTSGGSGGLLESPLLSVNTWVPVSSRTLLLNLDGVMFGGEFPQIILASPKRTHDLSKELFAPNKPAGKCPTISISGQTVVDDQYCLNKDTPLAFRRAVVRPISVVRVLQGMDGSSGTPRIMFTDLGAAPTTGAQAATSTTDIRVVSTSGLHYWSGATEVYFENDGKLTHLNCDAAISTGSKLICELPGDVKASGKFQLFDRAHILDSSSTVGPIKGWASLGSCVQNADPKLETCRIPTFSEISGPRPTDDGKGWQIDVKFINLNEAAAAFPMSAQLGSAALKATSLIRPGSNDLDDPGPTQPLQLVFIITPRQLMNDIHDAMTLTLTNKVGGTTTVQLANILSNLQPKAATIGTDFKTFSGSNLIADFTKLRVGANKNTHGIRCNGGTTCQLDVGEDLTQDPKGGYVTLVPESSTNVAVSLMSTQTGATTFATYTPPPPPKPGADKDKGNAATPLAFSQQIQVNVTPAPIVGTQNVTNPTAAPIVPPAPAPVVPPAPTSPPR